MILDLRTIFAVGAVTCIVLGLMQVLAYILGRFDRWPLWWGASNSFIGLGIITAALRDFAPDLVSITLANTMMWGGCLLLLMGIRSFAGRPPRLALYAIALILPAVLLTLWIEPEGFSRRVALMCVLLIAGDLVVIREGWRLYRDERLVSALLLISFFGFNAALFTVRGGQALMEGVGSSLFSQGQTGYQWLSLIAIPIMVLRGNVLLLLAVERGRRVLLRQAQHDPLTGALNRSGLQAAMEDLNPKLSSKPLPLSLLLIDLDHFKELNDSQGHAAGDMVLSLLATTAQSLLPAAAKLARQGGDEFAIVLPGQRASEAVVVAERLRIAFGLALRRTGISGIMPTLSIGIAEGRNSDTLESLLLRADGALYRSKRMGRNKVQVQTAVAA